MHRAQLVKAAVFLWALVVFMPVGANYLGAAMVLAALMAAGEGDKRMARLRAHPLRWPLAAYVAWTLVVFALRPHYPETASNLWHGLRIATTMAITLVPELELAIDLYVEHHNANPKPFIWTASANDILAKVTRAKAALERTKI